MEVEYLLGLTSCHFEFRSQNL